MTKWSGLCPGVEQKDINGKTAKIVGRPAVCYRALYQCYFPGSDHCTEIL